MARRGCSPRRIESPKQSVQRERVVCKVFDNADFGFHKITVERPLRLNFQTSAERIVRLEDESGFKKFATSTKKNEKARLEEIEAGKRRQEEIRMLLAISPRNTARRSTGTARHSSSIFVRSIALPACG